MKIENVIVSFAIGKATILKHRVKLWGKEHLSFPPPCPTNYGFSFVHNDFESPRCKCLTNEQLNQIFNMFYLNDKSAIYCTTQIKLNQLKQ